MQRDINSLPLGRRRNSHGSGRGKAYVIIVVTCRLISAAAAKLSCQTNERRVPDEVAKFIFLAEIDFKIAMPN